MPFGGFNKSDMNNNKVRLLKKQAALTAQMEGKDVKSVYKSLKKMIKAGVIKFDK